MKPLPAKHIVCTVLSLIGQFTFLSPDSLDSENTSVRLRNWVDENRKKPSTVD